MTSLLEAIADVRSATGAAKAALPPPPASEAGLRLAMQLRDVPARSGGRVLLFMPSGRHGDASPAVGDTVAAFLELQEGPVLIVDLRSEAFADSTPGWFDTLPGVEQTELHNNVTLTPDMARISRPLQRRRDRAPYSSTPRFLEQLDEARSKYCYAIYIGDPMPSRDTLMSATAADGVVMTVPPGHASRTELNDLTQQLRRARAKLLGFVLDPRAIDLRRKK